MIFLLWQPTIGRTIPQIAGSPLTALR